MNKRYSEEIPRIENVYWLKRRLILVNKYHDIFMQYYEFKTSKTVEFDIKKRYEEERNIYFKTECDLFKNKK